MALALQENPEALILCNGYKDRGFIETALLAQKLGRRVISTIDRLGELRGEGRIGGVSDIRLPARGGALGFLVETAADRVSARMAKQEAPYLEEKLDLLGRLLIYTRQMDMMMHTEAHVDHLTQCFLDGNYSLDTSSAPRRADAMG